jgi:deoxyadenosine/deoxycytidine kinase
MSERDYGTYRQLFDAISPYITKPNLLIYLKASVPTLMERITMRSRDCESGIAADYLEHLNERYREWMEHFTLCPVLTLEADKLDFVQRDGDLLFVFDEVRRYLGGEPPKAHQPLLL